MNYVHFRERKAIVRLTGAIYTPDAVARAVTRIVASNAPDRKLKILEPSVGEGAFFSHLVSLIPGQEYVAVDIDAAAIEDARIATAEYEVAATFHNCDFIEFASASIAASDKFDLIVGNPPFIRKHNFSSSFKEALTKLAAVTDYPLPQLKNSWAAFLLASSEMVSEDGIVALVLPYELMTVDYGQGLLKKMLEAFERIDLFVSGQKAFPEIEQDAVIFIGQRQSVGPKGLYTQLVNSMTDLSTATEYSVSTASGRFLSLDLNAFLIPENLLNSLHESRKALPTLSRFASNSPGVVTAANDFFIVDAGTLKRFNLEPYALPILKKQKVPGRSPVFSRDDYDNLAVREASYLLHFSDAFDDLTASARAYLKIGMEAAIHLRFKCQGRKQWYQVPLVSPASAIFFRRSHALPRVCVNEAGVYITDNAYGLYPRENYTARGICFSFYNSLTMLFAETNGRFYGGGVLELSPNELRGLPFVYHEPSDEEFEAFVNAYEAADGDPTPVLNFGDSWLAQRQEVAGVDLAAVRAAWIAVRSHRLRHSSRT